MQEVLKQYKFKFFVITLITLCSVLGITSVPPAFPAISEHFNIPLKQIGILMGVFTLPGIILNPIFGYLADRYSRQAILIPSMILFAIAGFLCIYAQSFEQLVILRLIQGIGTASLGALNISLIGDVFPQEERSKFTGYNSVILSLGTAFFPLIGGKLTTFAWYATFYLSLFAFIVAILYIIAFRNTPHTNSKLSLIEIKESLKDRQFLNIIFLNTISYFIVIGCLFTYLPFHLRDKFQLESQGYGLYLFILSIAAAISASQLKRVLQYIKEITIVRIQLGMYGLSLLIMPFMDLNYIFIPIIIFGTAFGLGLPGLQYWVLRITPQPRRGSITAMHRATTQVGQTFGPILMGYILNEILISNDVSNIFLIGVAISTTTIIISFFTYKPLKVAK